MLAIEKEEISHLLKKVSEHKKDVPRPFERQFTDIRSFIGTEVSTTINFPQPKPDFSID